MDLVHVYKETMRLIQTGKSWRTRFRARISQLSKREVMLLRIDATPGYALRIILVNERNE
jgi:hypothetical protein